MGDGTHRPHGEHSRKHSLPGTADASVTDLYITFLLYVIFYSISHTRTKNHSRPALVRYITYGIPIGPRPVYELVANAYSEFAVYRRKFTRGASNNFPIRASCKTPMEFLLSLEAVLRGAPRRFYIARGKRRCYGHYRTSFPLSR